MSADYEPTKEQVEELERELCGVYAITASGSRWTALTRFVLRRQHEREEAILAPSREQVARYRPCMQCLNVAEKTLAAHAALDAPKVPTLLEAAKAVAENYPRESAIHTHMIALKAAVEREERKK